MADKCSKCNGLFNSTSDKDSIGVCCECSGYFHAKCCSVKVWQTWTKRNAKREEWRCDTCKPDTASSQTKPEEISGNAVLSVLNELRKEIADNHRDTKSRFDDLDKSINTLRESVIESQRKISVLEEDNAQLKDQLNSVKADSEKNTIEMRKMKLELHELQQYSRRHNLEIKGVPVSHGENVYAILECISRVLDVPWNKGAEISIAHRLRRPDTGPPAIVVAFVCRSVKDAWLFAARSKKLTTKNLSPTFPPGPIYINSHLTGHNKQLLGRARQLVRDGKLANAWTVNGKVLVRRMSGGVGIRVVEMEDFDKVVS